MAALVSSSVSLAAPATPLMTSDHFRRSTSVSSCLIAKALLIWAMWFVIDGNTPAATVSTRPEVCWTAVSRASTLPRTAVNSLRAASGFLGYRRCLGVNHWLHGGFDGRQNLGSIVPSLVFLDRTPSAGPLLLADPASPDLSLGWNLLQLLSRFVSVSHKVTERNNWWAAWANKGVTEGFGGTKVAYLVDFSGSL